MRPGPSAAGGAGAALLLLGAFAAFSMTRPPPRAEAPEVAGAPVHRSPARPKAAPAPAPGSLKIVLRAPEKHRARPVAVPGERTPLRRARPRPVRRAPAPAAFPGAFSGAFPGASADVFHVRLQASPRTPRGYAYADALRAALARQGAAAARPSGRVIWSVDREFVARLPDGSRLAITGGYGVTELSFRVLTPQTCRVLFGAAEVSGSYLTAPGAGLLQPPGVGAAERSSGATRVADARELCLRLAPAFEAWRRAAPPAAPDLSDLDRRRLAISSPGPFTQQPAALAAPRRSLIY